ncbi:MAG: hypothetical protein Q3990_03735 [Desulfovibrionaceae bacterium]|nr:hypothetical protein [Desulfovibrionaceae bacterium]
MSQLAERNTAEISLLLQKARSMTEGEGRLVFLTVFGSALYGTSCEGLSDLDVRGLYIPYQEPGSKKEAEKEKGLHYSTGSTGSRNDSQDVDIDLLPFDRWMSVMLAHGDIGALDLLYAPTNEACTLYCHPAINPLFARPLRYLDLSDGTYLVRYCQGQGNTYGLSGTRLGTLWRVYLLASELVLQKGEHMRVRDCQKELAEEAGTQKYCIALEDGGLLLCGQCHAGAIQITELCRRLEKLLGPHRERIESARSGKGVDWKALAHAMRAIWQVKKLLTCGELSFPLSCAEELRKVRLGKCSFAEVEKEIVAGMKEVERLRTASSYAHKKDEAAVWRDLVLYRNTVLG